MKSQEDVEVIEISTKIQVASKQDIEQPLENINDHKIFTDSGEMYQSTRKSKIEIKNRNQKSKIEHDTSKIKIKSMIFQRYAISFGSYNLPIALFIQGYPGIYPVIHNISCLILK